MKLPGHIYLYSLSAALLAPGCSPGRAALVAFEPEAPSDACPAGGVTLYSGLDTDGDGVLEGSERTGVNHLCNGAAGAPGTAGAKAVFRQTPLPGAAECPDGAVQVDAGADADGDGRLDQAEIRSTITLCVGLPCEGGRRFSADSRVLCPERDPFARDVGLPLRQLAVDEDGAVYTIAPGASAHVARITAQGSWLPEWLDTFSDARRGVDVSARGRSVVFVASTDVDTRVERVDTETKARTMLYLGGPSYYDLVIDTGDQVVLASSTNVVDFAIVRDHVLVTVPFRPGQDGRPGGLAVDAERRHLYVSVGGTIYEYPLPLGSADPSRIPVGSNLALGRVAADESGAILAICTGPSPCPEGRVLRVDLATGLYDSLITPGLLVSSLAYRAAAHELFLGMERSIERAHLRP